MADLSVRFEHFKAEHRHGYVHFRSFQTLSEGVESRPAVAQTVGQAIIFAANAHLETACGHLARLLDRYDSSDREPLSFRSLLLDIRANSNAFPHVDVRQLKREIRADLHWCSPSNNANIDWLVDFRNNALAHYGGNRFADDEDGQLNLALKYAEYNLGALECLFDGLGTRISKYQIFAIDVPYSWEDWYIPDGHSNLLNLIEQGLS